MPDELLELRRRRLMYQLSLQSRPQESGEQTSLARGGSNRLPIAAFR